MQRLSKMQSILDFVSFFSIYLQHFMLEVLDAKTHLSVANTTNVRDPAFTVTGLRPSTGYIVAVHSFNAKGASKAMRIHAFTAR